MKLISFSFCLIVSLFCPILKCEDFFCFHSNNDDTVKKSLPKLQKNFYVNIEFVDLLKIDNFESSAAVDIEERYDFTNQISSLKYSDHGNNKILWLFNRSSSDSFTYFRQISQVESNCTTRKWSVETSQSLTEELPLFLPSDLLMTSKKPLFGLADLYDFFLSTNISRDKFSLEDDHGLKVDHLIGCSKTLNQNYFVQFAVCVTKDNVRLPGDIDMKNVPTMIQLKIYNGTNSSDATVVFNGIYEMAGYRNRLFTEDLDTFLPPAGVYCDGWPDTKPFPQLPKRFSVRVEYYNGLNTEIDNNELFYDDRKMVGFIYSHKNDDEPMTLGLDLDKGRYKIVHDFRTGLQYVLDEESKSCRRVTSIPSGSADVKMKGGVLDMKDAAEILYSPDKLKFSYIGKKTLDELDITVHVWSAPLKRSTTDTEGKTLKEDLVYEVHFQERLTPGNNEVSLIPFTMTVYHRDNYNRYHSTTQHFYDFVIYDDKDLSMRNHLNVFSCLTMSTDDSFLMFEMNGTSNDIKLTGNALHFDLTEKLSSLSNVNPIRIPSLYFQPVDNTKKIFVYFTLAEIHPSDVIPAPTVLNQNESKAFEARKKLNETISSSDVKVEVSLPDGKIVYFSIKKGSLNTTAPYFQPKRNITPKVIIVHQPGYTGGSLAALCICMLLIGGVSGLVGAFYMWKRNRGIVYHIYE